MIIGLLVLILVAILFPKLLRGMIIAIILLVWYFVDTH